MIIRNKYLDWIKQFMDTEFIKVITGVRRSGKSSLLMMFKEYLEKLDKNVFYINFEHPDYYHIENNVILYEYIKENANTEQKIYFIFDEIAEVTDWQKLINGLRVAYDCDIYITGSNSNLLSGELATYLTGRYVELMVFPLSFKEYMVFNENSSIDIQLEEYIKFGGFPSVSLTKNEEMKKTILSGIYNSIILKDVSLRGSITNIDSLLKISSFLLDNIGNSISSSSIQKYLKNVGSSISVDTINKYLNLLESSFIFYRANRYDIRGKERLKTLAKYYVVDLGLKNIALGRMNTNLGSMVENLVYLKLKQDGYEVFVGKYNELEIDFVCFKSNEIKYVQVTLTIPENSERESKNLLYIKDNYERVIVTYDYSDVGYIDGIKVVHLTDFLIE